MRDFFVDLHIHIGRTASGKPVKITGAKRLTLSNIIEYARSIKGIDMIGIIDCHVPEVIAELEDMIAAGEAIELSEGGIDFHGLTLILGTEMEIYDDNCKGPIHVLAFMPQLQKMKQFSKWLAAHVKNITLSSQRVYEQAKTIQHVVCELGGMFIPAHVFTPHKSLYGKGVENSLREVLDHRKIDAIELGLSSDTAMADQISELHHYSYISNSDAHSLEKIAREYQTIRMEHASFNELRLALHEQEGRKVSANFGLNPYLGKYYYTSCEKCSTIIPNEDDMICPTCEHNRFTKGVYNRLLELKSSDGPLVPNRPPYIHQVPLEFIPKLGSKTLAKLRDHFKTDMAIIHDVPEEGLRHVVSDSIAETIIKARRGELQFHYGGAGRYGKVKDT
ncbi:endonuclease Q family protein [Desertibacillus haloalkaliphilus]|uniref:endonuclease Q family protein n=1 Tax=Desertibacillus haloalkaliphilus TaxID=1328930 RepID=UPI001C27BBB0|nr:endonuclease Q family protein [Desertibacillus haloalkaliphilus]MBU8907860.1 endonuclease Q family protein [Desertibacillus haloalkaliphilus]